MRTEQLAKCCEPQQKLRASLGTCKSSLNLPVILLLIVKRGHSCNGSYCLIVLCLGC